MKISEYIKLLEDFKTTHGDLNVVQRDFRTQTLGAHMDAQPPRVDFECILSKREKVRRCWFEYEGNEKKGNKLCRVG